VNSVGNSKQTRGHTGHRWHRHRCLRGKKQSFPATLKETQNSEDERVPQDCQKIYKHETSILREMEIKL
jgi:hypothetical protein